MLITWWGRARWNRATVQHEERRMWKASDPAQVGAKREDSGEGKMLWEGREHGAPRVPVVQWAPDGVAGR